MATNQEETDDVKRGGDADEAEGDADFACPHCGKGIKMVPADAEQSQEDADGGGPGSDQGHGGDEVDNYFGNAR